MKKKRRLGLAILMVMMLGAGVVYFWHQSRPAEFYPILHTRCIEPVAYDHSLSGQLVLVPFPDSHNVLNKLFSAANVIYALKTGEATPVNERNATGKFASSPDGKQLAYEEIRMENGQEKRRLVIRSYRGNETRIELGIGQSFVYWVDNNKLMLQQENAENLPAIIIFYLGTGESQRFLPDYPRIDNKDNWPIVYSPDMTRVLYGDNTEYIDPTYVDIGYFYVDSFYADLILYDNKHHKELLQVQQVYSIDSVVWKQDSSGFFVVLNNVPIGKDLSWGSSEVRFINRDGIMEWQLRFSDLKPEFRYTVATYLSLSPDGHYMSIEVGPPFVNNEWQLIIDTTTGDVFDYCIQSGYPGVWSPDSNSVAFLSERSDGRKETVIINVLNRTIYKITDGYIPVGWLR